MDDRKIYFYKNGKLLVSFEKDETIKDGYTLIPAKVLGILPALDKKGKRIYYDRMEVK